jgi:hypothetical protein
MSNLINTGTIVLNEARLGATVPLTLSFSLGPGNLDGGKALLVVYDLDQYKQHQATLQNGETDDTFFTGQKTVFGTPPEHKVEAGSGILFMAEATFVARPQTAKRKTIDSFVQKLENVSVIGSPAYSLEIRCLSSVDAQGNTLSPQVIDVRRIAVTGAAQADYDAFTKSGDAKRSLTIRLLSLDRSRVLVSQLNPGQCFANQPVKIRYDAAHPALKVNQSAPDPAAAPPPTPQKRFADITGEYIELPDPDAQPAPSNGNGILGLAVLRVHHVNRAVCGWYTPLPPSVRAARTPATTTTTGSPLFPDQSPRLSSQRGVFMIDGSDGGKIAGRFVFRDGVNRRDELDPDALFAQRDLAASGAVDPPPVTADEVVKVHIEFEPGDLSTQVPPERIRIRFPPLFLQPDVVFARLSGRSRLSWQVVHSLGTEAVITSDLRQSAVQRLKEDLVEPVPPAVLGVLMSTIISPEFEALVVEVSKAKSNNQQVSLRVAAENKVNEGLDALAAALRSIAGSPTGNAPLSPTLIAQVREVARLHQFTFDGATTDMLSALQIISDDIVERKLLEDPNHIPGTRPVDLQEQLADLAQSAQFDGFAAFNILPGRTVLYRFEFTDSGTASKQFIILNGTFGAFLVKISKLDAQTLQPIEPATFPTTEFGGFFFGGSIGVGLSLKLEVAQGSSGDKVSKKGTAGSTIGPMSVDFVSFSNLSVKDFEQATFSIFAAGASASASAGPGKAGAKDIDAIFSLTTSSVPPVTLEAEIKKGFQTEAKLLSGQEATKTVLDLDDAIQKGKSVPIAQASASLTLASLVSGFILQTQNLPPPTKRADKDTESIKQHTSIEVNQVIRDAKFAVGSAVLTNEMRFFLELRLAVQRKLLEYPGWMDIEGLASPEWDNVSRADAAQKNLDLSNHRADAVEDAIFDACGAPGDGIIPAEKDIRVAGKGSKPFDAEFSATPGPGQHLDVFVEAPNAAVRKDRDEFLPTLRRVDVAMNGVFALRVLGR